MGPKLDLTHGLGFQKLDLTYRSGIHRYPQKPKDPLCSLNLSVHRVFNTDILCAFDNLCAFDILCAPNILCLKFGLGMVCNTAVYHTGTSS